MFGLAYEGGRVNTGEPLVLFWAPHGRYPLSSPAAPSRNQFSLKVQNKEKYPQNKSTKFALWGWSKREVFLFWGETFLSWALLKDLWICLSRPVWADHHHHPWWWGKVVSVMLRYIGNKSSLCCGGYQVFGFGGLVKFRKWESSTEWPRFYFTK